MKSDSVSFQYWLGGGSQGFYKTTERGLGHWGWVELLLGSLVHVHCSFLRRGVLCNASWKLDSLWEATERSGDLANDIARALRAGDVAMVKGSNGSRMGPLVAALRGHFARPGA